MVLQSQVSEFHDLNLLAPSHINKSHLKLSVTIGFDPVLLLSFG